MIKVGIDAIGFYTPHYYLDLATLAEARNIDVNRFYANLGQKQMAISAPDEDIVTMGANAAYDILSSTDIDQIDNVIVATETGIDYSKAAGIYMHKLLNLQPHCRTFECKQACYAGTAALQMGLAMLRSNQARKILVIATDIAHYGFNTTGESSQGAGAIAMLLSENPRILAIEPESGVYTEDAMDFWRPNYCDTPFVNGKLSCELYIRALEKTWEQYSSLSGRQFTDHDYFCYHVSVPKLVASTHKRLMKLHAPQDLDKEQARENLAYTLNYGMLTGNCYSAALYISLLSLLDTCPEDLTDARVGLYSYGSGCVGEFFSGIVQQQYQEALNTKKHQNLFSERNELTYAEYEEFCNFKLPTDDSHLAIAKHETGKFRLSAIDQHKRIYESCI